MRKPNLSFTTPAYIWQDGYEAGIRDERERQRKVWDFLGRFYRLVHISHLDKKGRGK